MKVNMLGQSETFFNSEKDLLEQLKKLHNPFPNLKAESNKKILIEGFNSEGVADYLIVSSRLARALNTIGISAIVLVNGFSKRSNFVKAIYDLFIKSSFIHLRKFIFNPYVVLFSSLSSIKFILISLYKRDFTSYRIGEILVGDLIYDTILINKKTLYTIDCFSLRHLGYLTRAMFEYYSYIRIIKTNKPVGLFVSHLVYSKFGILARLARKYGVKVFLLSSERLQLISDKYNPLFPTPKYNIYDLNELSSKISKNQIDEFINNEFYLNANNQDRKVAFNKPTLTKNEIVNLLNLDPNKQTLLIAMHTLSDAPHKNRFMLHKDFYDWYYDTLTEVTKSGGYNYIVKTHPSAFKYNEPVSLDKDLYVKDDNLKYYPNEYSTTSLISIVDAVVTVSGTMSIEFACHGIPSIITGEPFYSNQGFTIEPQNLEEYHRLITSGSFIPRLDSNQISHARLLFYYHNKHNLIPNTLKAGIDRRDKDNYIQGLSEIITKIRKSGYSDSLEEFFIDKLSVIFSTST
jgi:hypothetical protein